MRPIKEWESINERPTAMLPSSSTQYWERLDYGLVKENCDWAMSKASDFSVGGIVLTNHNGIFIAGAWHFFPSVANPELAGLLACRRAIKLAMEINVRRLVVKIYSHVVVIK